MKSLRELFRVGQGPSSSHTMGPRFAAERFHVDVPQAARIRVTLYGSLAATGAGHLTDLAVTVPFHPVPVEIVWQSDCQLPRHPNGLKFETLDDAGQVVATRIVYSIGGGALLDEEGKPDGGEDVYPFATMDEVLALCDRENLMVWELVARHEGTEIWPFLADIWRAMQAAINCGLNAEGKLPGALNVPRKASAYYARAKTLAGHFGQTALLFAYAQIPCIERNAIAAVRAIDCAAYVLLSRVRQFGLESGDI